MALPGSTQTFEIVHILLEFSFSCVITPFVFVCCVCIAFFVVLFLFC